MDKISLVLSEIRDGKILTFLFHVLLPHSTFPYWLVISHVLGLSLFDTPLFRCCWKHVEYFNCKSERWESYYPPRRSTHMVLVSFHGQTFAKKIYHWTCGSLTTAPVFNFFVFAIVHLSPRIQKRTSPVYLNLPDKLVNNKYEI